MRKVAHNLSQCNQNLGWRLYTQWLWHNSTRDWKIYEKKSTLNFYGRNVYMHEVRGGKGPNSICYEERGIWKSFLDEWRSVIAYVFLRLEIKDQTNPKQNHKEILT